MLKLPTKPRTKAKAKATAKVTQVSAKAKAAAARELAQLMQPQVNDSIAVLLAERQARLAAEQAGSSEAAQKKAADEAEQMAIAAAYSVPMRRGLSPEQRQKVSPHLVDLGSVAQQESPGQEDEKARLQIETGRPQSSRLQNLLDERIYLSDLVGYRSVSPHPHGFGHFPPKEAVSLLHAVAITMERMFVEHPLSELVVGTLLHVAFRAAMWPFRTFGTLPRYDVRRPTQSSSAAMSLLAIQPSAATSSGSTLYFEMPLGWRRKLVAFACLAAVTAIPFQTTRVYGALAERVNTVRSQSLAGVAQLKDAERHLANTNFADAQQSFTGASAAFSDAEASLGIVGSLAAATAGLVSDEAKAANALLNAASAMAVSGNTLTAAFAGLKDDSMSLSTKLAGVASALAAALPVMNAASAEIADIEPSAVPESERETLATIQRSLPPAITALQEAHAMIPLLDYILGASADRRYLVVFQNDAELRPTGGFIGSYAMVDVANAKVKAIAAPGGGSYDLQGSLMLDIAAPQPLHLIRAKWEFQDANWSPDFPTTARRLMRFHEKSGQPSTDGVIAINASIMEKLLAITGPIEMPEYGKTIDAVTFRQTLQQQVELDYNKEENKPKQIIADLAPIVLSKLLDIGARDPMILASTFAAALSNKEVQMYVNDPAFQENIASLGWAGAMRDTDGDYLAVVHTNIAGQKTDAVIANEIAHEVTILPDGSAIAKVTLTRQHNGVKGTPFSGVRNVDFVRFYTPLGSTLIEASGFTAPSPTLFELSPASIGSDSEIAATERSQRTDEATGTTTSVEHGKTVFGNWLMVDPGQKVSVSVSYQLPKGVLKQQRYNDSPFAAITGNKPREALVYSLLVQPQSGASNTVFSSTVHLPKNSYTEWRSPELAGDAETLTTRSVLSRDTFLGALTILR